MSFHFFFLFPMQENVLHKINFPSYRRRIFTCALKSPQTAVAALPPYVLPILRSLPTFSFPSAHEITTRKNRTLHPSHRLMRVLPGGWNFLYFSFFSFFSARREKKTQETSSDRTKYEKSRKIAFRSETKKISYAIRKSFFLCLKIPAHFRREVRKLFQRFSCVKIVEMKNP